MTEENQTLNEDQSAVPSPADNPDDLIATVDEPMPEAPPEEVQKTDKEEPGEVEGEKPEDKKEPQGEIEPEADDRLDKHPRFKELIQTKNDLKDQVKALQQQVFSNRAPAAQEDLGYKDISKMSAEDLRDWIDDDPLAYTANIAKQVRAEVTSEMNENVQKRSYEDKIIRTFDDYASKHKSFDTMWDSGELKSFIDKNPGHNAISAHMALTAEVKLNTAIEKAQKETEERITKQFKSKIGARTIPAGPASTGTAQGRLSPDVRDPKKFGGKDTVLAARLKERRRQAYG